MNLTEFIDKFVNPNLSGWIVASLTDEYIVDSWPMKKYTRDHLDERKILEIRIFNADSE